MKLKRLFLTLFALCLTTTAFAEEPLRQSFFDNAGGLNSHVAQIMVQPGEATALQNVFFTSQGQGKAIVKRTGSAKLNSSAVNSGVACTALYFLSQEDGTQYLVGIFGNDMYKMDSLDGTWDDINDSLTITAGQNNLFSCTQFNDWFIATNGVDAQVIKWTGAGNAAQLGLESVFTKAKYVKAWKNRLWVAGTTEGATFYGSRLRFSDDSDPEEWNSADTGYIDIGDDLTDPITGLGSAWNYLYVFKTHAVYVVWGSTPDDFAVHKLLDGTGCVSHWSIVNVDEKLFVFTGTKVLQFTGMQYKDVSTKITKTILDLLTSRFNYAIGGHVRALDQYWLAVTSTGSTNNQVLVYDYRNSAWSVYTGLAINQATEVWTSNESRLYTGDYSGFAWQQNTGTNDGSTAVDASWTSRWHDMGHPNIYKTLEHVHLHYVGESTASDLKVQWDRDFQGIQTPHVVNLQRTGDTLGPTGSFTLGTSKLVGATQKDERIAVGEMAKRFMIQFNNSDATETFQVIGYTLAYRPVVGGIR